MRFPLLWSQLSHLHREIRSPNVSSAIYRTRYDYDTEGSLILSDEQMRTPLNSVIGLSALLSARTDLQADVLEDLRMSEPAILFSMTNSKQK